MKSIIPLLLSMLLCAAAAAQADIFELGDGESLFYEKLGDGPRTIIIASHAYTFPALKALDDQRWTLVAYDPRSRGRSSYVDDAATIGIDQDVRDLEALRRHLGAEQIDLVGFSFAGRVVTAYASEHAGRVGKVSLIAPAPVSFQEKYRNPDWHRKPMPAAFNERIRQVFSLRDSDMHASNPQAYCYEERALWPIAWASSPAKQSELLHYSLRLCRSEYVNEWPVYFDRYRAAAGPSRQNLFTDTFFEKITAPTLLIHGSADRNSPPGGSRFWAWRLAEARLVEIEGQAHALHVEEPERVANLLRTFFGGEWPRPAEQVDQSPLASGH